MSRMQHSLVIVIRCLVFLLVFSGAGRGFAQDQELPRPLPDAGQNAGGEANRFITIDFDNVDIHLFIKYISELTGRNFIVDKVVQGNVTIISPTKISVDEAYRVFLSVLEVHGFTTVDMGSAIKILPSARARSEGIEVRNKELPIVPVDKMITQLVRLKYSSPEEIQKVLTPLVSQTSVIISHPPSGMLIITETKSNIEKLLKIIAAIDVESRENEVAVIPLQNASAEALGKILATIYQGTTATAGRKPVDIRARGGIQVVPYDRVNALIVLADANDMNRVKNLIAKLDTEVQRSEGNIHVYYLQNATAAELAKVLTVLPEKQPQAGEQTGAAKAAAISKDVQVLADEETNSLIITAAQDEYKVLEDVIRKLDIPRRMVYLEALIMEVDADKSLDVGVEWAGAGKFSDDTGILATGFSGSEGFNYISGLDPVDPALPPGYSFGILKQGIRIGDVVFPNIAAMLHAFKTNNDVNIIATPQILTTDNKKAEISVGENVPFITSKNTTASQQDYTQYEYRDVATKLTITPHINQANTLRLEIDTEVVRLKDQSGDTPTTFKRTASTTVILNDTDTIVIGGIIGQDNNEAEWKVPLLGDIPVLGWLFKTHTSTERKTNMFIFITPRIVRNPADAISVTLAKDVAMEKITSKSRKEENEKERKVNSTKLTEKGFERLQAGDLANAKDLFKKALKEDPTNPYAAMDMGVVYEREGAVDMAIEMYRSVIGSGTREVANVSSDPDKAGVPLVQIARENIERLEKGEGQ